MLFACVLVHLLLSCVFYVLGHVRDIERSSFFAVRVLATKHKKPYLEVLREINAFNLRKILTCITHIHIYYPAVFRPSLKVSVR